MTHVRLTPHACFNDDSKQFLPFKLTFPSQLKPHFQLLNTLQESCFRLRFRNPFDRSVNYFDLQAHPIPRSNGEFIKLEIARKEVGNVFADFSLPQFRIRPPCRRSQNNLPCTDPSAQLSFSSLPTFFISSPRILTTPSPVSSGAAIFTLRPSHQAAFFVTIGEATGGGFDYRLRF